MWESMSSQATIHRHCKKTSFIEEFIRASWSKWRYHPYIFETNLIIYVSMQNWGFCNTIWVFLVVSMQLWEGDYEGIIWTSTICSTNLSTTIIMKGSDLVCIVFVPWHENTSFLNTFMHSFNISKWTKIRECPCFLQTTKKHACIKISMTCS